MDELNAVKIWYVKTYFKIDCNSYFAILVGFLCLPDERPVTIFL